MNRLQQLHWRGQQIKPTSMRFHTLTRVQQKGIGELQLTLKLIRPFAFQIIQYAGELRGKGLNQSLRSLFRRQRFDRASVLICSLGDSIP